VLTVTALQEIPSPPGTAKVRVEVEIEQPAEDEPEESQPESDPEGDALSGAAKVAGGLVVGACKLVRGALGALTDDEKEVD
jgi:hypothetical protein